MSWRLFVSRVFREFVSPGAFFVSFCKFIYYFKDLKRCLSPSKKLVEFDELYKEMFRQPSFPVCPGGS